MKKYSDYFLGLDIGTGSVGWAVTDNQYNLLKANQKTLWGVKLFETANTAEERRIFRTSRRRLKRRNQRIKLLQQLFAEEISKVDPGFFLRLKESKYLPEDKLNVKGNIPQFPYALFSDEKFTDIDFHKKYPTIYHLRHELMSNKSKCDPRLVYLALHHIIKHRGHFLFESLNEDSDIQNFSECWKDFSQSLADSELEINDFGKGLEEKIENILKNKNFSLKKKLQELKTIFNTKDTTKIEILNMIVGGTVTMSKLFSDESLKEEEIQKFSFREGKYEEDSVKIESILQERFLIVAKAKAIYDWEILIDILNDCKTLSEAKIKTYNKHKDDLILLKKLSKKLDSTNKLYNNIFGITKEKGHFNYSTYVGLQKKRNKKIPIEKIASKDEFYTFLKKVLKEYDKNENVKKILEEIELGIFLPKQVIRDNGVIPYQLHFKELKSILSNAEVYLSFLKDKDENGLSVSDKIISVFKFRIPYYVGPLSTTGSKDDFAWIEKKSHQNIYPWNFDEVIDLEQSAENFIRRMTNKCTYLTGEDVLPKNSLLYSEFTVLNELNTLRINGERINPELKNKVFEELFKRNKKVTMKKLKEFLKCEGAFSKDDEISGTDGDFKSSCASFMDFKQLGLIEILSNDEIENLISDITLFLDDKKILKGRVVARLAHHKNISEKQINAICKLTYKDWGRLSKRFLTEIEGTDKETGEMTSIINFMRNYSKNLMELLNDKYTFIENIENYNKELSPNMTLDYSTVKNLYVSPSVKRSIWQTIKIVKELKKVLKKEPKKVFIEMAREKQESKRTESRKTKLIELYKSCKKEEADLYEAIEKRDDHQFRSDQLYLYFTQKGRCPYCGKDINLDTLYDKNIYDIDHIYPQSKVTDDSLDNRVLVHKTCNSNKSDVYPLPHEIINANKGFWNHLKEIGFISQEKFNRLTRTTPFSNDELSGFINRQLVETRQSTKAVASILKQVFPNTEIVYVKAKNVSKFRQDFKIIKVREINDLHHAKDAFLNIVVGNVYNTRFTNNVFNFIKEAKYREYNLKTLFNKDVKRNNYIAWKSEKDTSINHIRKIMKKNNILVIRKSEKRNGGLFKQNILKKGKGQLAIKSLDSRLQNKEKYGAYNEVKGAYFLIVESTIKGKKNITIEFVPIYLVTKLENNDTALLEYCKSELKLIEPRILISKVKIKSHFIINNSSVYIAGRTSDYIEFHNANQLLCANDEEKIIKKIIKYNTRLIENQKLVITKKDELTNEDLISIYQLFTKKLSLKQYSFIRKNELNKLADKKVENNFISLSPENKAKVLFQIMKLFSSVARINLSDIGGSKECGRIIISKNLSKLDSVYIVYSSTTGIFENKVDLFSL
ncbi:type II CRISPR RNA-guided endonuclease Cas9 [Fusobacterium sp. PH5-44]|uniref:type II CRISPR RNA-guided endonuclease Cas9 n=1 Tax=unclassified Fusobacterium TaxID=2648384 RepID=UPI003D1CCC7C